MRRCHRPNAAIERSYEVVHRAARVQCMSGDGANGREHVLDAMVEFGNQCPLVLLRALTFSDIDVDANHPLGAPVIVVRNEAARFDPSHLTAGTHNAILGVILAPLLLESLVSERFYPRKVPRVGAGFPLAARTFDSALG